MPSRSFRKLEVVKLSTSFREATRIVDAPCEEPGEGEIVVEVSYAGVNASDVNFTAGKYTPGVEPPFDAGFEALGRVIAVGHGCKLRVGDAVVVPSFGAFAERLLVPEAHVFPVPSTEPEILPLLVSGLTAKIALDRVAELTKGETVLVTAAAGATGQFACQLAKLRGCTVIGTCSTDAKAAFLRSLGVDRPVNYKKEDLGAVLRDEFPRGLHAVYESVGGAMFDTAVAALRPRGRLVVIGFVSGYRDGSGWSRGHGAGGAGGGTPLPVTLLAKSASVRGFFLNHFRGEWGTHFRWLVDAWRRGDLVSRVDAHSKEAFRGIESVPDAVDHLYSGKSSGKVVVRIGGAVAAERPSRL